jgi:hypothetical protein
MIRRHSLLWRDVHLGQPTGQVRHARDRGGGGERHLFVSSGDSFGGRVCHKDSVVTSIRHVSKRSEHGAGTEDCEKQR